MMNERIQELVRDFAKNIKANTGYDMTEYDPFLDEAEKFAQLIVQEVVDVIKNVEGDDAGEYVGTYYAEVAVKKHFGVEE